MRSFVSRSFLIFAITLSGCASIVPSSGSRTLANFAPQASLSERNPVIVIHGTLGSKLVDDQTGRVIWGAFGRPAANPSLPSGARSTALPMAPGVPLSQLRNSVRSDGALEAFEVTAFRFPLEIRSYTQILKSLDAGGYRHQVSSQNNDAVLGDDYPTCFQFDFDWRRDISENAVRLHEFIGEKRAYVEEQRRLRGRATEGVKFNIVAHSMGGLLTRYYLRYGAQPLPDDGSLPNITWDGCQCVEQAILIGTPNAGSALAFLNLLKGTSIGPLLPKYAPALVGTMPAIYQLLPRSRHGVLVDAADHNHQLDIFDPQLWHAMQWGLASPNQDWILRMLLPTVSDRNSRFAIALDHQSKCLMRAGQFHAAIDIPASPPSGLSLHLFAGDSIMTDAVLAVDLQTGKTNPIQKAPGDGVTTFASAAALESLSNASPQFVSTIAWKTLLRPRADHLGLTQDTVFTRNILPLLEPQANPAQP